VVRLITDQVSPLLAVELSDGTTLKVTADHPFWVDSGDHLTRAGWLHTEHLRPGDRLRTAKGRDAVVVRVRRNVGHAVVYTLTVAHDHTFFVGSAHVLVHNSLGPACGILKLRTWQNEDVSDFKALPPAIPVFTTKPTKLGDLVGMKYLYVITSDGQFRMMPNEVHLLNRTFLNPFHHPDLAGAPDKLVVMAGDINFDSQGRVVRWSNDSGHYRPQPIDAEVTTIAGYLQGHGFETTPSNFVRVGS